MLGGSRSLPTIVVWVLAVVVALLSARYFLVPPPMLRPPPALALMVGPTGSAVNEVAPYLYFHHRPWFLLHIAGGVLALSLGPWQFVGRLRDARPSLHRVLGRVYLGGVLLGSVMGLPLSFFVLGAFPRELRPQFFPMITGLASLSLAWPLVTGVAFARARRRRFAAHRRWMVRSYSLTFAAVTIRLLVPALLLLTGDAVIAVNVAFLSWPFNLLAAEWLLRRQAQPAALPA